MGLSILEQGRIDYAKLHRLVTEGKSGRQIAAYFGVTPSAVSQAKRKLKIAVVKDIALENAHKIVDKSLNAADQLHKINEQANKLLDDLEKDPSLKIKVMAEIRGQLKLQLEIFKALYDMEAVAEFQREVLTAIGEESPDVKNRIVKRLKESRSLRCSIKLV